MIKQLLKQIWTQRGANAWLWLELLIVSVCLWYITDYLYITARTYFAPLGYDIEHTYRIQLGLLTEDSDFYREDETDRESRTETLSRIVDRIKGYPGIESMSFSSSAHPYRRGSSMSNRLIDSVDVNGYICKASPSFFRVFRITDKKGEIEPIVEAAQQSNTVIITAQTEKEFIEKGMKAFNSPLKNWGQEEAKNTIRAICADVRWDAFNSAYPIYYEVMPDADFLRRWNESTELCVRVDPKVDSSDFLIHFKTEMKKQLQLGNFYLIDIAPLSDYRDNYYRANGAFNDLKTNLAILFFLLINIFLGVVGTFWVRTQNRKSELGLRLALGSSKFQLKYFLISEGIILLLLTLIFSGISCYQLIDTNLIDTYTMEYTISRFLITMGLSYLLIAGMIVVGIYIPARRAANIDPSEVLHEE